MKSVPNHLGILFTVTCLAFEGGKERKMSRDHIRLASLRKIAYAFNDPIMGFRPADLVNGWMAFFNAKTTSDEVEAFLHGAVSDGYLEKDVSGGGVYFITDKLRRLVKLSTEERLLTVDDSGDQSSEHPSDAIFYTLYTMAFKEVMAIVGVGDVTVGALLENSNFFKQYTAEAIEEFLNNTKDCRGKKGDRGLSGAPDDHGSEEGVWCFTDAGLDAHYFFVERMQAQPHPTH